MSAQQPTKPAAPAAKVLSVTVSSHGKYCVVQCLISDDIGGGSAVPAFGKDALRVALRFLEHTAELVLTEELELVPMLNEGRTLDAIRAEMAASGRTYHTRECRAVATDGIDPCNCGFSAGRVQQ